MRRKFWLLAAVASFVAVVSLQSASAMTRLEAATPGVTKGEIVLGGTFPLSGPVSGYAPIARGMEAYFKYINARKGKDGKRGVGGRQIVWKYYDDAYNPANAVQLANKLVLEDKVFAVVGTLGTENNQAIRPFLNQRKVPQLLVSTGASYWGLQYKQFPWTMGWQPDYISEGRAYGGWIAKNHPNAKIADLLPERRLRQGLRPGPQDRPRREAEPDRLRAVVRGHGHELRLAAGSAEGKRCGHLGRVNDGGDPDGARDSRRQRR